MNIRHTFSFTVLLLTVAAHSQPGTLDTTFDPGVSTTGFGDYVYALAVQDDGRIIIAGGFDTYQGEPRSGIARLHPDGTLDMSFDPGTGVTGDNAIVRDVYLDSDGRIMIAGSFWYYNGTLRNYVARLNADGSLDTSFDPGDGPNSPLWTVEGHDGNKYLIGGGFSNYLGTVTDGLVRLNNDGSMDPSFNPGGTGAESSVRCIATYADGRILIGGQFTGYNGATGFGLARLLPNGTSDAVFSVGAGADNNVYTIAIQSDEMIIIGGGFNTFDGSATGRAARLFANGSVDTGFITGAGVNGNVYSSAIQADGAILLGGGFTQFNGTQYYKIVRLDQSGALDPTFTLAPGPTNDVEAITLQADGRIMIGGIFIEFDDVPRRHVARLNGTNSNGIPVHGTTSMTLTPNPVLDLLTMNITSARNGAILEVHDATGKQVLTRSVCCTSVVLDVQSLAPGLYSVHTSGALPMRFVKE